MLAQGILLQESVLLCFRATLSGWMVFFSVPRLEGRALEHAMSGFGGHSIRMYDDEAQTWVKVADIRAKLAMACMQKRAATLRDELKSAGLAVQGADRSVRVNGTTVSVDLRVWVKERSMEALLEMKWTRQSLDVALSAGLKKVETLKQASVDGKWLQSNGKPGKTVRAAAVGVLAVGPRAWKCLVQSATGEWSASYPTCVHVARKSGKHRPGSARQSGRHKPGVRRPSSGKSGSQSSGSCRRFLKLPLPRSTKRRA